jgi:hypothetical protein
MSPMVNSYSLLGALQGFLRGRRVQVEQLTAEPMVGLMIDWFRLVPINLVERPVSADALVYRSGGWSEGCATAFRLSLLRRITEGGADEGDTDWFAGITLLFEPSRCAELVPFQAVSSDWKSIEAFLQVIESSPAFMALASATPMGVLLESGGLR